MKANALLINTQECLMALEEEVISVQDTVASQFHMIESLHKLVCAISTIQIGMLREMSDGRGTEELEAIENSMPKADASLRALGDSAAKIQDRLDRRRAELEIRRSELEKLKKSLPLD